MKKNARTLFINMGAIIAPIIILFIVLYFAGYHPLLTNSVSFDAKIENLKAHKIKQVDMLAVGSSMTLNNVQSQVVVDSLKCSYYNLSSWGLQISDLRYMLKYYVPKFKPRYVLLVSSVVDFTTRGNSTIKDYIEMPDFLKGYKPYFYYQNFNPILSIVDRKHELNTLKNVKDDYTSLSFDEYGGIPLKIPPEKISAERWNYQPQFPTKDTDYQYEALDSLARHLNQMHIKLFFVQPPIKRSYVAALNDSTIIPQHFSKSESIVTRNNGIYINLSALPEYQTDKLFIDQFHLSDTGARLFSQQFASKMRQLMQVK